MDMVFKDIEHGPHIGALSLSRFIIGALSVFLRKSRMLQHTVIDRAKGAPYNTTDIFFFLIPAQDE